MKLYLVWNEAKTECAGFVDEKQAFYAKTGFWSCHNEIQPSDTADHWNGKYGDEECTIQEIEV